ncbi:MAG: nucleotide exchange factor GrpE [Acidimicrobiia bacterium]
MTTSPPFDHGGGPPFDQGGGPPPDGDERDEVLVDDELAAEDAAAVVESDLAQLQSERSELVDTLRRVQADFENYRKRVIREQTSLVDRATERLVEELLPVLDSFDGALAHAGAIDADKLVDGVSGIHAQLVAVLAKHGLERMAADGTAFDPNEHEAVMQDDGPAEPSVAQTMRAGYRLKGRVVRPAMVRVTREG